MGAALKMALEVDIVKRLPDFTLEASFTSGGGPLGILGPSGAGKTMLLRCIAGLERPDRGRIVLEGRTLFDSERNVQSTGASAAHRNAIPKLRPFSTSHR